MAKLSVSERYSLVASLSVVIFLTVATRLYKLEEPAHIAWDETHFGKFASYYINRTFFLDVHPPLGKMLIALAGYGTGYDGNFPFGKPTDPYGNTSYYGMRLLCATCGMICVPLAYMTVNDMTGSVSASFITSVLMIFDTGLITISQYILLDPVLLVFIMLSVFFMARTQRLHREERHFTAEWWLCLAGSGLSLGCAISVKWVGLFIVLLVGMSTAVDLWTLLADTKNGMVLLVKHLSARVLCLILLPIIVYIMCFDIHFKVLTKSGSGDAFFSSAFQSTLSNNAMNNSTLPPAIAYGSVITLRNGRIAGGLLHSHHHLYPEEAGPKQQQITIYHHRDDNNKWIVRHADSDNAPDSDEPAFVHHGDYIRLEHLVTNRLLHSHYHKAPVTKRHYQVTGYGFNGSGDMNDIWQIQVKSHILPTDKTPFVAVNTKHRIQVLKSRLYLIHNTSHCALHSTSKQLPEWGFEQKEVSCNPKLRQDIANTWIVEGHENSKLANVTLDTLKPSLLSKIYESHVVMAQTNSGFKPKPNEQTSRPWMWPTNYRGQVFSGGSNNMLRVYLLGNPVIWWMNTTCVAVFIAVAILMLAIKQRGAELDDEMTADCYRTLVSGAWLLAGWLLHYVPFLMMARVLYFHHYMPAVLFNAMLSGVLLGFILRHTSRILSCHVSYLGQQGVHGHLLTAFLALVILSFALFHPLSYGMTGETSDHPDSQMHGLKWLSSWEF